MIMKKEYYCSCCGEKIKFTGRVKEHAYKVDETYQCSYKCYSIEFDKKYKESKTNIYSGCLGYTRGRSVDRGYERHGSR
jgi:hypothetical protein